MSALLQGFLRRRRYGMPVVVVSGLPRSGTSMMMKMLDAGGLELVTDRVRTADEDNPKGYFEDERIKHLERLEDKSWLRDCRGKAVKVISFLLKDLPAENFYQVIFMRRTLEEVLASQRKMLVRRGEGGGEGDEPQMLEAYRKHLRKVEIMLGDSPNFEALDVDYRAALDSPREHAERVRRFLGRPLDLERMVGVVDRQLYRNRA